RKTLGEGGWKLQQMARKPALFPGVPGLLRFLYPGDRPSRCEFIENRLWLRQLPSWRSVFSEPHAKLKRADEGLGVWGIRSRRIQNRVTFDFELWRALRLSASIHYSRSLPIAVLRYA